MIAVELKNISKSFKNTIVLNGISAELEEGHIYGLIGDNGSGKSVLLKCIAGLLPTDEGEVRVFGRKVIPGKCMYPAIGLIIEHPGFIDTLSGYQNLKYLAGINGKIKKEEVLKILDTVGLTKHHRKKVKKYSLGMRQRLAIAQAIMERPNILIMDEPFNGLDKNAVDKMRVLFKELRNQGKTIIISSHNEKDIALLCEVVYEIADGNLRQVQEGKCVVV